MTNVDGMMTHGPYGEMEKRVRNPIVERLMKGLD